MLLTKLAEALLWKTNILFYRVTNFILRNSVDGFFRDIIFNGVAAMLAVLSLVVFGVAAYFFAASLLSLLRHEWMEFMTKLVLSFLIAFAAYLCEQGTGWVVLAEGDDEDEK